jgi:TATA-box binding protein (TBP) (component of TFIID and TFIIIB)
MTDHVDGLVDRCDKWTEDMRDAQANATAHAEQLHHIKCQAPDVSTMTVCFTLNEDTPLAPLRKAFNDDPDVREKVSSLPNFRLNTSGKGFHNCLIFKFDESVPADVKPHKRSVKVFSNGRLHITGLKNIDDNLAIAAIFCEMFDVAYAKAPKHFEPRDYEVQMVNTSFAIDAHLNLQLLLKILRDTKAAEREALKRGENVEVLPFETLYEPEVHASVRLHYRTKSNPKFTTVLIFASGIIVITAVKSPMDMLETFHAITRVLDPLIPQIRTAKVTTAKRAREDEEDANGQPLRKRGGQRQKRKNYSVFDYGDYVNYK